METPSTTPGPPQSRKRYEAPRLEALGSLADQTLAGQSTVGENIYS